MFIPIYIQHVSFALNEHLYCECTDDRSKDNQTSFFGNLTTSASGCTGLRMPKSPSRMPEQLANSRQISGEGIKLMKHFEG
jgi:hypothetical protein